MANLNFSESHKIVTYLFDPPVGHQEFSSMVHGLRNCKLSHAFQSNPIIYQELVRQFWDKASFNEGENGEITVESVIQVRKIVVSEQIIRKVLLFKDQQGFPIEIPMDKTEEILHRMGYEEVLPPTLEKLLPPY
ncbi:unnamed protein product [Lactuca saligna]|uniref:Uncharacterized protein n=1 Tax=Lactuca saligna TaxID=75948 RepID=A0AA35Z1P0_LACSI|nr:unnamed protein product [Lactuca saligna]